MGRERGEEGGGMSGEGTEGLRQSEARNFGAVNIRRRISKALSIVWHIQTLQYKD